MIRKANLNDLNGVVKLGLEALKKDAYKGLLISEGKVKQVAKECISSPRHFCYVCEEFGEILGAVTAQTHDMLFYERDQASIIQFCCKKPGEGIKLIREFIKWADSRRIIKAMAFTLEHNADPRIGKMLKRLGFYAELPVYFKVRGQSNV